MHLCYLHINYFCLIYPYANNSSGFSNSAVQKYYSLLANRLLLGNNGTIIAPGLLVVLHLCDHGAVSNAMIEIARDYMADILQFDCKNRSATIAVGFLCLILKKHFILFLWNEPWNEKL